MGMMRLIYSFILFSSLICGLVVLLYTYNRRSMPGAKYFIAMEIFIILYSGAYMVEINSNTLQDALIWFNLEYISIIILPYLWLRMSLAYVSISKKHIQRAKGIMLCQPIFVSIVFYTNSIHHEYIKDYSFVSNGYFPVIIAEKGPLYMVVIASFTIIGLICATIYVNGYRKSLKGHRAGYVIMIIASLFPWASIYLTTTNLNFPYLGMDYFPVITVITGLLYMYGMFQYKIFNIIPIATEKIFRHSKAAILLIDLEDHIFDVNDTFMKIYPQFDRKMKNNTLSNFLVKYPEFSDKFRENGKFQYELVVNGQTFHYSAEITKIYLEEGIEIGKILEITDITLYVENEKRLESMALLATNLAEANEISFLQAQIKPHFINNSLSVISSMITRDPVAAKELLVNLSEYLIRRYSYGTASVMAPLAEELEIVNTYLNIQKARFRERLNFELICEESLEVNIPRFIIQPLIENALRHGILKKIEGGKVSLKISSQKDKIDFEIQDDGVGIEEERIEALLKGEDKNQGVGIYNVNKRLIKHYGEGLKIISNASQGTTVLFSVTYAPN